MIDVSKIRVGDEVTVRAMVRRIDGDAKRPFEVITDGYHLILSAAAVATHTTKPREFKPGDRVTWGKGTYVYEFIAQRGDCAVAWNDTFGFSLQPTSDLRHADESE